MNKRIRNYEKGFSLIELMVALVVFAIGFLGIMGTQLIAVQYNAYSKEMADAMLYAQDLAVNMPYMVPDPLANFNLAIFTDKDAGNNNSLGEIDIYNDPPFSPAYEYSDANLPANYKGLSTAGTRYQRYWNVANIDLDGDGSVDAHIVAVIVRWKSARAARYWTAVVTTTIPSPIGT